MTTIVQQLPVMPLQLVEFLDLHLYDVVFLTTKMALDLERFHQQSGAFTILELHAISERLRLPSPSIHSSASDFSHILDFCGDLKTLTIVPTRGEFETKEDFLQGLINPILTSNILPSTLNYELKPFASCKTLNLLGVVPQNITKCDVRSTVTTLTVNFTRAQNIQQILLPEIIHDSSVDPESLQEFRWSEVKLANFRGNDIWTLDAAMKLLPNVEEIDLQNNRLRTIANLSSLYNLSAINLSGNLIESLKDWHRELGNVATLNLSYNKLKSLEGLSRLRSLISLDLSFNQIENFEEIAEVARLPIVENVSLNGNPISSKVDYRVQSLTRFEERCAEVCLDNERCSQIEIDKALVHAALRKSKLN